MKNTAENDFLGFHNVKWLYRTGEVNKSEIFMSNFLRIQHAKNHQNRLIFDRVIKK